MPADHIDDVLIVTDTLFAAIIESGPREVQFRLGAAEHAGRVSRHGSPERGPARGRDRDWLRTHPGDADAMGCRLTKPTSPSSRLDIR